MISFARYLRYRSGERSSQVARPHWAYFVKLAKIDAQ
jgi:hypothetical protein